MSLTFRPAQPGEHAALETLIIDAFEPITWFRKLDETHGPLNGCDWRTRWRHRLASVFTSQIILVGETSEGIAAVATGTYDPRSTLAYIDLLAVDRRYQGRGYGRAMLRAFVDHLRGLGARYCNLECLTDNTAGNELYRSEGWTIATSMHRWFVDLDQLSGSPSPDPAQSPEPE
ncbi:MAG: GNAT family N-acetyltransferase [Acidobacteria bacterium]|nr:GNAT family N-acetyltransferase [Acidobacteriota bacterium]